MDDKLVVAGLDRNPERLYDNARACYILVAESLTQANLRVAELNQRIDFKKSRVDLAEAQMILNPDFFEGCTNDRQRAAKLDIWRATNPDYLATKAGYDTDLSEKALILVNISHLAHALSLAKRDMDWAIAARKEQST